MNAELRASLPGVVMAGAEVVASEVSPRIPRRTGDLAAHLDESMAPKGNSASATVEITDSEAGEQEQKAIFLEYGTSKMPAQPFFRPGVEAAKPKVAELMLSELQSVIARHER